MEVVPIRLSGDNNPNSSVGLPFSRRNVEEWSRIDRLTGMMETAKIETDHWTARSNNAAHNYGKVELIAIVFLLLQMCLGID